jgi:hypothetical protein
MFSVLQNQCKQFIIPGEEQLFPQDPLSRLPKNYRPEQWRKTCFWREPNRRAQWHAEYRSHNNLDAQNLFRVNHEYSQAANTSNGGPKR